jgi:hypothetical protein
MVRTQSTKKIKPRERAVKKVVAPREPDIPPTALITIDEFCARNRITRPFFYRLLHSGLGPATLKLRKRRLISPEAEDAWRREAERRTTEEAAA